METQSDQNPAPEEQLTDEYRMVAMFSHLSIFFGNLILPLIFWLIYREKSKFAAFHAMQSLIFHIAYFVLMVFVVLAAAIVIMLSGLGGSHPSPQNALQIVTILFLGIFVLGYIFGSIGYAVYLAIRSYKGDMKKYPVIGNIVYKKIYGIIKNNA